MNKHKRGQIRSDPFVPSLLGVWAVLASMSMASASPAEPRCSATSLDGTWLFDTAQLGQVSQLQTVWRSTLVISHGSFRISRYRGLPHDLTGRFQLSAMSEPSTIDLHTDPLGLRELGTSVEYPAADLHGIYEQTGDRLTLCLRLNSTTRPKRFSTDGKGDLLLRLVRTADNFARFPDTITVSVRMPDRSPSAGAKLFRFMRLWHGAKNRTAQAQWQYIELATTGQEGTAEVPYERLENGLLAARTVSGKFLAIEPVSPASTVNGKISLELHPQCLMYGTIGSDELVQRGDSLGWTNASAD